MTKRSFTRFLFTFICVFALACILMPGPARADTVTYITRTWNGSAVSSSEATRDDVTVFPKSKEIASGWYYVNRNITIDGRVSLQGDTQIILGDRYTLDVKGLYIPQGYTLTIYGQNAGTGKLYSHPSGGAAIGAYGNNHPGGSIVIHGGTIEAVGASHCAGIGSNDGNGTTAPITIYGGTVTAKGGSDGAAIGGGRNCDGGTITIYGGNITANGPTDSDTSENGAGIGGGDCGNGGNITIHGGTITTYSRDGAGIGGGDDGDGGTITINGGTITSTKVNQGQGARIGGGCDGAPGTIAIHGGTITTVGGKGAGIGGGKGNKSDGTVTIDGGVISASGSYGIGSGESGSDVAVTLGYTDAAQNSISINSSSYKGTVVLQNDFQNTSGKYLAGSTPDQGKLAGSALVYWDSMSWADLQAMIDSAADGDVITLENDVIAKAGDTAITVAEGKNITLELNGYKLDRNAKELNVSDDVIKVFGSLTVKDSSSVGTGTITGAIGGSGVNVRAGSLTLNSGTISGNQAASGGGVKAYYNCLFTMNGGAIMSNRAEIGGGVMAFGEFVMNNGTISKNIATGSDADGNDDAISGGGVLVVSRFTLKGGKIEENTGIGEGGGVYNLGGVFEMTGGKIANNMTYALLGAGVENGAGTMRMSGGEISGNKAQVSASVFDGAAFGGGVFVREGTKFEVSGSPIIKNNKATITGYNGEMCTDVLLSDGAWIDVTGSLQNGAEIYVFPGRPGMTVTKGLATHGGSDPLNYVKCDATWSSDQPYAIVINADGEAVIGIPAAVTYKANDGSTADYTDNVVRDMDGYVLIENPFTTALAEKLFYHWTINNTVYYPGDRFVPTGNTTVNAFWGSNECYTVSFEPGQPGASGSMYAVKVEKTGETASYTLPDCGFTAPEGYAFDGWKIGDTAVIKAPGEIITLTENVTITATWKYIFGDWAELQSRINVAGNNSVIQLDKDYTATENDEALLIPSDKHLTLDLNGHTINRNDADGEYWDPAMYVYGSLTIKDSSSGQKGKITGGSNGGVIVGRSGTDYSTFETQKSPGYLRFESGSITGNKYGDQGGGVSVIAGNFTMTGGVISYNSGFRGAGVYVSGNSEQECFVMTGGKIVHNTSDTYGGGVYLNNAPGSMSGGEISQNKCDNGRDGGGIYLFRSSFTMSDGMIINNTATGSGGGIATNVYASGDDNIKLTILDGEISGNRAASYGGGIFTRNNVLISGGTITGNTAGNNTSVGGGIYQDGSAQIELSGTPVITDNMADSGKTDNIALLNKQISITGALTDNAHVGVNVWEDSEVLVPDGNGSIVFTTGLSGKGSAENFSSDNIAYAVSLNSEGEAMLGWTSVAAEPMISPESGTYTEAQSVEITCETEGAVIYYTTDGSDPTTDSAAYSEPIPVAATTTIKAIAVANEMTNSEIAEATYTMKTAMPVFSPEPGIYGGEQNVTITCATEGATIYYTTDLFTDPLEDGIEYTGAIPVTASVTIKAAAVKDGIEPSDIAMATYSLNAVYMLDVTVPEFSPVRIGYDQPAAQPLTIVSSSNTLTTISSVALSGESETAFVLNKTDGTTIAAGATDDTTYTIRPAAGLAVGTYTATVTVAYDNDETAQAEVSFTVEDLEPCEVVISVQKTLSGCEWTTEDCFEFTLAPVGEAPAPETVTETVTIDSADHTEAFEPITITAPGTYSWTVSETHKGETLDGIQYASEDQTVTVIVKNDGTGILVADEGSSLTPAVTFTNTFVGYSVTFRVVNGSWDDDGTKADRTITVGYNQLIPLDDIPDVGDSPDEGYMTNGSWDIEPPLETQVTQDVTYTYTYYPPFGEATFTLPSGARTIEANAFEGDTLITVVDASSCETIGAYAFSGCTGLTKIRLPINCTIGEHAFDGCTTLYAIYGPTGGTTQDWAENHDILFIGE